MIHIIEVVKATFFVDNAADLRGSDCSYELFERARCASHSFTQSDPIKYASKGLVITRKTELCHYMTKIISGHSPDPPK